MKDASTIRIGQRFFFANQIIINHIEIEGASPAIMQAYATGCYSMKETAQTFDIEYATVSEVLKKGTQEARMGDRAQYRARRDPERPRATL